MKINRRNLLAKGLYGSVALTVGSITGCAISSQSKGAKIPKYVINGNMVLHPSFGDPLDAATKEQLKQTGLHAIKLSLGGSQGTYQQTIEQLESLPELFSANPDIFMPVNSIADLRKAYETHKIGIIYSFEAATMLVDNLDYIEEFASRGVRIMQPGYNNTNAFGAGVMSTTGPLGLSKLGEQAIEMMQNNDVLVDLSHAHEETIWGVLKISRRPVAMTHTGVNAVNLHQRNKSDRVLKAIADQGGVVGIYEMSYLTPDLKQQSLDAFLAHILHAVNVCGAEHVGIGSDTPMLGFDTGEESMRQWNEINRMRKETGIAAPGEGPPPYVVGLNGPHKMVTIAAELSRRGLSQQSIDQIMGINFARVFADSW